jgi:hypothetical protein
MKPEQNSKKWNKIYMLVIAFLALQVILYYLFTLKFR